MYLDWRARNLDVDKLVECRTLNAQHHSRTALASHKAHHGVLRNLLSCNHPTVNLHDAVTRAHTRLRRGSLGDYAKHRNRICRGVKDDAYAIELTLQRLVNLREHLRGDILRVWVELREQCGDGLLVDSVELYGVDIVVTHEGYRLQQLVVTRQVLLHSRHLARIFGHIYIRRAVVLGHKLLNTSPLAAATQAYTKPYSTRNNANQYRRPQQRRNPLYSILGHTTLPMQRLLQTCERGITYS